MVTRVLTGHRPCKSKAKLRPKRRLRQIRIPRSADGGKQLDCPLEVVMSCGALRDSADQLQARGETYLPFVYQMDPGPS